MHKQHSAKIMPGLGAFYCIPPGNRSGLFYSSMGPQGVGNYFLLLAGAALIPSICPDLSVFVPMFLSATLPDLKFGSSCMRLFQR